MVQALLRVAALLRAPVGRGAVPILQGFCVGALEVPLPRLGLNADLPAGVDGDDPHGVRRQLLLPDRAPQDHQASYQPPLFLGKGPECRAAAVVQIDGIVRRRFLAVHGLQQLLVPDGSRRGDEVHLAHAAVRPRDPALLGDGQPLFLQPVREDRCVGARYPDGFGDPVLRELARDAVFRRVRYVAVAVQVHQGAFRKRQSRHEACFAVSGYKRRSASIRLLVLSPESINNRDIPAPACGVPCRGSSSAANPISRRSI